MENDEELKELIREEIQNTKKEIQKLPVAIRWAIAEVNAKRKNDPKARSVLFDEVIGRNLGNDITKQYKDIFKRSLLTGKTHVLHIESRLREPEETKEEPSNLIHELENLPFSKEIGEASELLNYLDFLYEKTFKKDHSILMLKLADSKYISNENPERFNNAINKGSIPEKEENKIVWTGPPAEAIRFCDHLGMIDNGHGKYRTWNNYFMLPDGKRLYDNSRTKDNPGGDIIDILENLGYSEGYFINKKSGIRN
ncbi:hypothetical protein [Marinilabilia salmonicolor]|uniref:hypothetical protein n=1 Tax=Marinilabilia salmonicolor TaxID=989 RepID=UPI0011E033AF|nr:hypothetical protein [Marinilabilia salmonicolor]